MNHSPLLLIHICAATIGLLSGSVALFSRKGSRLHRQSGSVFFVSMLCMSASAACLALVKSQTINLFVGVLTFYMVATAWLTVRRREGETGLLEFGLMLLALADGAGAISFGLHLANGATHADDGPGGYYVFGSIALLAAALDMRMLVGGGVSGAHRIARHLWRMCFALLITVISFFLGKERLFPGAVIKMHLNYVPILIVAAVMIYWLCRVLFTNAYKRPTGRKPGSPPGNSVLAPGALRGLFHRTR